MATGQTIGHNLPYPLSTDPVNVHGDIKALADRLEIVISAISSLPSQTGNSGKFLKTDGFVTSWASITVPTVNDATPSTAGVVYGNADSAHGNTLLGYGAGTNVNPTTDANNTFIGDIAGKNLSAYTVAMYANTALGHMALSIDGDYPSGIPAGLNYNTAIGDLAFSNLGWGDNNVALGRSAGSSLNNGSNNIVIGSDAQPSTSEVSNEITIGNGTETRLRLPGISMYAGYEYGFFVPSMLENINVNPLGNTYPINSPYQDIYLSDGQVNFFTANATSNWVTNLKWSSNSGTPTLSQLINNIPDQDFPTASITAVVMVTNGTTPYYSTALRIDDVLYTPKWQGGVAPTYGNASATDVYTYTIIPNGSGGIARVLASMTKFA